MAPMDIRNLPTTNCFFHLLNKDHLILKHTYLHVQLTPLVVPFQLYSYCGIPPDE